MKNKKITLIIHGNHFLSVGHSSDNQVVGVCLFDKYCWTNVFKFQILK